MISLTEAVPLVVGSNGIIIDDRQGEELTILGAASIKCDHLRILPFFFVLGMVY